MGQIARTLVLGLGNVLLGDDGVGVHAAHAFLAEGCPEGVEVLDVGTAVLEALPALERASRVIVVDAVKADGAPGTVYRMPFRDPEVMASEHGFDLYRALALANRHETSELVVIGVEPASIRWSLDLSPRLQRALAAVVEAVREECLKPRLPKVRARGRRKPGGSRRSRSRRPAEL